MRSNQRSRVVAPGLPLRKPLAQDVEQEFLGFVDPRRLVGPGEEDVPAADTRALRDKRRAEGRRDVLQGVEGRDDVEARVPERQAAAVPQHEPRAVRGLHVDEVDTVPRQEAPQERRAAPDVEHPQTTPPFAHIAHEVGDEAVALVLVEGQAFDVHGHKSTVLPRADNANSTAASAVRFRSSRIGLISVNSRPTRPRDAATISHTVCASR